MFLHLVLLNYLINLKIFSYKPENFPYVFNLREFSRLFKGLRGVRKEKVLLGLTIGFNPEIFIIAKWRHECQRFFTYMLIIDKEKDQSKSCIHEISLETLT